MASGLFQLTGVDASAKARYAIDMVQPGALEGILRALPYPAMLLRNRSRIVMGNIPAERLFEHSLNNIDLVRVLRHPDVMRMVNDVKMAGQPQMVRVPLHLPRQRVFDVSYAPLPAELGDYHMMTLLDVSAEIDAEKARSNFVANVSHELRSPLTAITGMIETLQGPARDDPKAQSRFLALMLEQAQRMSRLVSELLSLSSLEAKSHIPPRDKITLSNIIEDVIKSLEMANGKDQGRVLIAGVDGLPLLIGDQDQLTEVFQNLLENALKYSDPQKAVHVTATIVPAGRDSLSDMVKITIADQGEGIEAEHLPRLTERFYRVDSGRSREMGGTGLGLAIVKHIINRHRGRMRIESEKGVGTTVTLWLVAARPA